MPIEQQLYHRAVRILDDGLRHAPAAVAWAQRQVHQWAQRNVAVLTRAGFTLREISLGATWQD